jgi:hypothetical protein
MGGGKRGSRRMMARLREEGGEGRVGEVEGEVRMQKGEREEGRMPPNVGDDSRCERNIAGDFSQRYRDLLGMKTNAETASKQARSCRS